MANRWHYSKHHRQSTKERVAGWSANQLPDTKTNRTLFASAGLTRLRENATGEVTGSDDGLTAEHPGNERVQAEAA